MIMKLEEIKNKEQWDHFQSTQPWSQFTQSWTWGLFREASGCAVRRFALVDERGEWLCAAQGEYRKRALGSGYWFSPRGPVFSKDVSPEDYRKVISEFVSQIYSTAKLPRALFWRFEPIIKMESGVRHLPPRFVLSAPMEPASTILLNLHQSEEKLLENMHQKTRYNIKVAQKHGITVRTSMHPSDLAKFLDLMRETAGRDKFAQHQDQHLTKTFQIMSAAGQARLRVAELNGAMLAANMEMVFGDTATYLYGASSNLMRNAMAPYLLQWEAIKAAKLEGRTWYDFYGINSELKSALFYKSSWEGITRFKLGWGGERRDLIGTWDLPMNRTLYYLVFIRRLMHPQA
jgi:lipid II:glycine glycyltransferase (peptidoglycan interpeptide bridge formation enzyme)